MEMYDIIQKKRDKGELSSEEISFFIDKYTKGDIADYQASALLMAIFINDLNIKETTILTKEMIASGEKIILDKIKNKKVDKHSTGGIGDKTTLILGPMIAACGIAFPKMSGRGLGFTGGTLDKLDSINGFRTELTSSEIIKIVNENNLCICGQSSNIVPADKKIYSLRDVTATVESIPLIASSIVSKKLAIDSDFIILDVKVGTGAFMKTIEEAIQLSKMMVEISENLQRKMICCITDMDQPLGYAIGNSLEVIESINTLKGNGPKDLVELCLSLGEEILLNLNTVDNKVEARELLKETISSGSAYNIFLKMVELQGGDLHQINNIENFKKAKNMVEVSSSEEGYVEKIDSEKIGKASLMLGAGRRMINDTIDLTAGIILNKKIGDFVRKDESIAVIHLNGDNVTEIEKIILSSYKLSKNTVQNKKLILGKVFKNKSEIIYKED